MKILNLIKHHQNQYEWKVDDRRKKEPARHSTRSTKGKELERFKDSERLRIPIYSLELSKELVTFHLHISDMHYRHVACKICREHVKKTKELAKRSDQGMK